MHGPPPLGPGAPPAERLAAFYRAMTELLEIHGHLALAAETGARRYRTGAYRAWELHVTVLLADAGLDDHVALVHALLAPLAPDVYAHQRASGCTPRRSPPTSGCSPPACSGADATRTRGWAGPRNRSSAVASSGGANR